MSKPKKIKDTIRRLRGYYPLITKYGYGHKKPEDKKKRSRRVAVWVLLKDSETGKHTTYKMVLQTAKAKPKSVIQWKNYLQKDGPKAMTNILKYLNAKTGRSYQFQRIIIWTLKDALRKDSHTKVVKGRDKTKLSRKVKRG